MHAVDRNAQAVRKRVFEIAYQDFDEMEKALKDIKGGIAGGVEWTASIPIGKKNDLEKRIRKKEMSNIRSKRSSAKAKRHFESYAKPMD